MNSYCKILDESQKNFLVKYQKNLFEVSQKEFLMKSQKKGGIPDRYSEETSEETPGGI